MSTGLKITDLKTSRAAAEVVEALMRMQRDVLLHAVEICKSQLISDGEDSDLNSSGHANYGIDKCIKALLQEAEKLK